MASRTIVDSVARVDGPPEALHELQAELRQLEARFPGASFSRYLSAVPEVEDSAWVAPTAALVGRVRLAAEVSIWHGAVLRGDVNEIRVGKGSNIQDGSVVHLGDRDPTIVGEEVVVGHRVVLHGCTVEDGCLIGIQATVLDGARIGEGSVIGSGALVTAATEIPPLSLVLGVPAKVVKKLDPSALEFHRALAGKYQRLKHNHVHG